MAAFAAGLAGEPVWDDKALLHANAQMQGVDGLRSALTREFWDVSSSGDAVHSARYYRPVVSAAFWAQWQLFGPNPIGYHAVSLALHVACVLLALGWLRRRLSLAGAIGQWAAVLGAVLFALHPTRAEPVFWISGSTDLWMALWALLGLRAIECASHLRGVLLGSLCFTLAMLSKEPGAALVLLPVIDALVGPANERPMRLRRALLVLALVGAATAARLWAFPPAAAADAAPRLWVQVAARTTAALGLYATRIFWPAPASVELGFDAVDEQGAAVLPIPELVAGVVAAVSLLLLAVISLRKSKLRPLMGDVAYFLVPLAPVLHLLPIDTGVLGADRYLYLPLLGIAALLGRAAALTFGAFEPRRGARASILAASILALFGLACLLPRADIFSSDRALWGHETRVQPGNARAALRYARILRRTGELADALAVLGRSSETTGSPAPLRAELALCGAATVLRGTAEGDLDVLRAISRFFEDAGRGGPAELVAAGRRWRLPAEPGLQQWLQSRMVDFEAPRAVARARAGDVAGAEAGLRAALSRRPDSPTGWAHLALILARAARWMDARAAVAEGLRRLPNDVQLLRLDARLAASEAQGPR